MLSLLRIWAPRCLTTLKLGKGNNGIHRLIENPIQTLKPKQTLTLPVGGNYTFTVGARIIQTPSGAEGTITEFDAVSNPETITITDIDGIWSAGFLDANNNPSKVLHLLNLSPRSSCLRSSTAHLQLVM